MHDYKAILKRYWGYDDFRGIQQDIIESIGAGRDTLGLMPTGGGKSVTFQVPALAFQGVCIVITPLIALMKDQVEHLRKRNIRAAAIYSGMLREEIVATLENAIFGGLKILYVSPERLSSEIFLVKLRKMKVSFITVDEAHCISQWGYDFRPSYLEIANIRRTVKAPVLALTATATPKVIDDIQERLGFTERNVYRMSFERKNLAYVVRTTADKDGELLHILRAVGGSAIVYVRSRRRCKEVAALIREGGVGATFYHAGLEPAVKDQRQTDWQQDGVRVMVATNAFGMGIDKPDVRMVVHIDCPSSIEAYFQEAGRAGRDGKKAYAVLLYNDSDERKLMKRIDETYPEKDEIREVYNHLAYFYQLATGSGMGVTYEFDIARFCVAFKHFPTRVNAALHILDRAGYISYEQEPDGAARLRFLLERNELYRLQELTSDENAVITALLRSYGGLFTDYCYIDESYVALQAKMDESKVYMTLKGLSRKNILHFVPRRKVPYLTYIQDRVDGEELVLNPEIYEDRKDQFRQRIEAVISYARSDNFCRSRLLLRYFGETTTTNCGQCDVCLNKKRSVSYEDRSIPVRKAILDLLADGKAHEKSEVWALGWQSEIIDQALSYLASEEMLTVEKGKIVKS